MCHKQLQYVHLCAHSPCPQGIQIRNLHKYAPRLQLSIYFTPTRSHPLRQTPPAIGHGYVGLSNAYLIFICQASERASRRTELELELFVNMFVVSRRARLAFTFAFASAAAAASVSLVECICICSRTFFLLACWPVGLCKLSEIIWAI